MKIKNNFILGSIVIFMIALCLFVFLHADKSACKKTKDSELQINIFSVKVSRTYIEPDLEINEPFGKEVYTYSLKKKESTIAFSNLMCMIFSGKFPSSPPPLLGKNFYFIATTNEDKAIQFTICPLFPGDIEIQECKINKNGIIDQRRSLKYIENNELYNHLLKLIPEKEVIDSIDKVHRALGG